MIDPAAPPRLPGRVLAEQTRLSIPSLPHWIEPTVEYLTERALQAGACEETRSSKLTIALHEAITNAVIHGNLELASSLKEEAGDAFAAALAERANNPALTGRAVSIDIDYDGERCRWVITDEGNGFDVERVLKRCTSDDPEVLLASGRGILMMKSFLDEVRYDLGGRRVTLSLTRASGLEKRKGERVPIVKPFQVTPLAADGTPTWSGTYDAVSLNLSEGGVALLQQQLAHSGKVLIGISTDKGLIHIPAEIRHARPLGANGMELGCHFIACAPVGTPTSASLDEVHDAIGRLLSGYESAQVPPDERRVHERVVYSERIEIHFPNRPPLAAYARDLSKGGIAFIAQEPLANEVTLRLGGRDPLKVRCRVVRCSRIQEGFYDIGAAFQGIDKCS